MADFNPGDFIPGGLSFNNAKTDLDPVPGGQDDQFVDAEDWNQFRQAQEDIRTSLFGSQSLIDPATTDTKQIWVSKAGDDSNDGLAPAKAKLTVQAALNLVPVSSTILSIIHIGPGEYAEHLEMAAGNRRVMLLGTPPGHGAEDEGPFMKWPVRLLAPSPTQSAIKLVTNHRMAMWGINIECDSQDRGTTAVVSQTASATVGNFVTLGNGVTQIFTLTMGGAPVFSTDHLGANIVLGAGFNASNQGTFIILEVVSSNTVILSHDSVGVPESPGSATMDVYGATNLFDIDGGRVFLDNCRIFAEQGGGTQYANSEDSFERVIGLLARVKSDGRFFAKNCESRGSFLANAIVNTQGVLYLDKVSGDAIVALLSAPGSGETRFQCRDSYIHGIHFNTSYLGSPATVVAADAAFLDFSPSAFIRGQFRVDGGVQMQGGPPVIQAWPSEVQFDAEGSPGFGFGRLYSPANWVPDHPQQLVNKNYVDSSTSSEFDSLDPTDYDAAVVEDSGIVSNVTLSNDADGLLDVEVDSNNISPLTNPSFETQGALVTNAANWTASVLNDPFTELPKRRSSSTGIPGFPTAGSWFFSIGGPDVSTCSKVFPAVPPTNSYHQLYQQINFDLANSITVTYRTAGTWSGLTAGTVPFTMAARLFAVDSPTFDHFSLPVGATQLHSFVTDNAQHTDVVDVSAISGVKYLIFRHYILDLNVATNESWASSGIAFDNLLISPANAPGRAFIPIKATAWTNVSADKLLQVIAGIANGGVGARVGLAFRLAGFGASQGMYIVDWDPFGDGALTLRRGSGGLVYANRLAYPGITPTQIGVATLFKHVMGGARGNTIMAGEERILHMARETSGVITAAGQWGLYVETLGAGTTNFKFGRVSGVNITGLGL
jgi:hypothetical protein